MELREDTAGDTPVSGRLRIWTRSASLEELAAAHRELVYKLTISIPTDVQRRVGQRQPCEVRLRDGQVVLSAMAEVLGMTAASLGRRGSLRLRLVDLDDSSKKTHAWLLARLGTVAQGSNGPVASSPPAAVPPASAPPRRSLSAVAAFVVAILGGTTGGAAAYIFGSTPARADASCKTPAPIVVPMPPSLVGELWLVAHQSSVVVSVDGQILGEAPTKVVLPSGKKVTVTARRNGFAPWQREVEVPSGASVTEIRLERCKAGQCK